LSDPDRRFAARSSFAARLYLKHRSPRPLDRAVRFSQPAYSDEFDTVYIPRRDVDRIRTCSSHFRSPRKGDAPCRPGFLERFQTEEAREAMQRFRRGDL
ncbi:MAG: hypothetical protein WCI05_18175, partial [Myxococcales bacterium]